MSNADAPQVPDFDFLRPIGEGGFGQVWLAINRTTGQPRAVKVIPRARAGGRDPAGREIASLARLEANLRYRHPNLLVIHHVGETAEHLFYVMDLADDLSGEADPTQSRLSPRDAGKSPGGRSARRRRVRAIAPKQLLAALACLHEAGMVHRDVKPANCLFLGGELKLGDFGLLTAASLAVSRLGTLRYMPPDGCMDARADVYAAGLVIYEMTDRPGRRAIPESRRAGPNHRRRSAARPAEPARAAGVRSRSEPAIPRRPRDARRADGRRTTAGRVAVAAGPGLGGRACWSAAALASSGSGDRPTASA